MMDARYRSDRSRREGCFVVCKLETGSKIFGLQQERRHASIMKTNASGMSKPWSCAVVLLVRIFIALVVEARVSIDPFVELAHDHEAGPFLPFDIAKGERVFLARCKAENGCVVSADLGCDVFHCHIVGHDLVLSGAMIRATRGYLGGLLSMCSARYPLMGLFDSLSFRSLF